MFFVYCLLARLCTEVACLSHGGGGRDHLEMDRCTDKRTNGQTDRGTNVVIVHI